MRRNRIAVRGDIRFFPAGDEHEIVVDDVAARKLDGLDEVQRRLLAEHAVDDHARIVLQRPVLAARGVEIGGHQLVMLLNRQHEPGAQQQVDLGRRHFPRLGCTQGIQLADERAVFIIERDGGADGFVRYRLAHDLRKPAAQLFKLGAIELAANLVLEVLRQIHVARRHSRKHELPHARQVADHIADRGEQHAVHEIEAARDAKLDGRARDAANIALIIGVAVDHFELIAAAQNSERQRARGVDQLPRHVEGHEADDLAARLFALSTCRATLKSRSAKISSQRAAISAVFEGVTSSIQLPLHWAGRLARKASRPSTASRVLMSSLR